MFTLLLLAPRVTFGQEKNLLCLITQNIIYLISEIVSILDAHLFSVIKGGHCGHFGSKIESSCHIIAYIIKKWVGPNGQEASG